MSQPQRKSRRRVTSLEPAPAPSVMGETVVPNEYRPDALDYICEQLSAGEALTVICADDLMPSLSTVRRWLNTDPAFKGRYLDALRVRALTEAGSLIDIADSLDNDTPRQKLRIDTRLKVLAKLEPEVFGDKVEHGHTVVGELAGMLKAAMNKGHKLPNTT